MSEKQAVDLGSLLDSMVHTGHPPATEELAKMAAALGKMFDVAPDEVAILTVSQKNKILKFVIPEKLSVIGSIPLSSTNALAARTARERKAELTNTFNTSRHASVFEGVPLGRHPGESIHKMMSAPIVDGTKVLGGTALRHPSWRSLRKRFSSPKVSESIGSGSRVLSSHCGARESRRATSCACPPFFLPTA